ncbi:hypothetical protein SDRG_13118 [Saprolegnia diclina VS20]|uniref:Uncharacterized protein n=1 Tax=Saprolegnia diclina (strain VS20) TaxID=1156394 RepID=T0Q6Z5_SAPDV|nr:hypothetical protein SDRG_13118 [Saprolegnia diclina VS20]EQC29245.1 hypothetical protein SDRG_13118 [Saprolegnia diclina VS20]|eukprot:XP_008617423.1 hypothetical protein SDRG_13118 [Saprolegnia diclina VS20]
MYSDGVDTFSQQSAVSMSTIKAKTATSSDAKAITRKPMSKPTTTARPVSNQSEKAGIRDGSRARLSTSRSDKEPDSTAMPQRDAPLRTKKPAAKPSSSNNDVEAAKAKKPGHPMPSQALNKHKQADPWSTKKKHKTNFGAAYAAGNIPCRINHGGIKNALQWNQSPEDVEYNPLLVTCCEGFQETDHPYVFLARQGFNDLMTANGADDKVRPLLGLLIPPIRAALMAPDDDVLVVTLKAIQAIADAVGSDMNVHLPKLIQQIHRKYSSKALRATIDDTLGALERNGGPEALRIIRTKIPTYASLA